MAYLDQTEANKHFQERTLEGLKSHFPITSGNRTLELTHIEIDESKHKLDDLRAQHEARVKEETWGPTAHGHFVLKDHVTGEIIDKQKIRLAQLPTVTPRRSFIIDGSEYQADNQWQLKPGVFTRRATNDDLVAAFNPAGHRDFKIVFEPNKKRFVIDRGTSSAIPLYPVMKAMGTDDDTLEALWGKEIFSEAKKTSGKRGTEAFFRADKKRMPKDAAESDAYVHEVFGKSELDPSVTQRTLGKRYSSITKGVLEDTTAKMLRVYSGAPEDDRDSIITKRLRSMGDYTFDRLTARETKAALRGTIVRKMQKATSIRDLIKYDKFNAPIRQSFKGSDIVDRPDQFNPVEMMASAQQTTIKGEGGIQNSQVIDQMVSAKYINPSSLGFIDPVRTPESESSGIVLRLPMSVHKKGMTPVTTLYNLKTNKLEEVDPVGMESSVVLMPDQVKWKDGKPIPIASKLKASIRGGAFDEVKFSEAQYVMRHPSQLFSLTTNLIPFLGNNSGNRASYAGQHIEQAISLRGRDAPLVQVSTGLDQAGRSTFEEVVGKQASHVSPVAGVVHSVKTDAVIIKDSKGAKHEVHLYHNFPLNDPKTVLHSTASVKVGDAVKPGQVVADTNFTRNGTIALGTNLRVGYLPYKGYNFEDGVVISQSAANKMASEHLHKPEIQLTADIQRNKSSYRMNFSDAYRPEQYDKLDEHGVIKVGARVGSGDPLILAMRDYNPRDRMSLQAVGKALAGKKNDNTLRWRADHAGEVVGVHHGKDKITVHIRTVEPMQMGDKLAGRHGNKGIVTMVVPDAEMPHTKDGRHIEVALNPSGVPGRMNVGQVLETAAGKIAEKTGKTYIVDNFSGDNHLAKIKGELKKHGLTDKEELFDPATGHSLGPALVGPQHMLKMTHQIDKKNSVRSGMALPGSEEEPESYDSNLTPARGGKTGAMRVSPLDLYVLLAHGARANIREMQTWKSEGPDPQPNESKKWNSDHFAVWEAMQQGTMPPPPKTTFAYQKFVDMLRGAGVKYEKKGHQLQLSPLTNKDILALSNGELTKPALVAHPKLDENGEPKPIVGGIFDPKITGGHGGKGWSHFKLAEPMPNPVFEDPVCKLVGLTKAKYLSVVQGKVSVSKSGSLVDLGAKDSITGGLGIQRLLDKVDVHKDLAKYEKELKETAVPHKFGLEATPKIDGLAKKVKFLRALKSLGHTASEAYMLQNVPVLPPAMRTISALKGGRSVQWGDVNELYSALGQRNDVLKDPDVRRWATDHDLQEQRQSSYDALSALMGIGTPAKDSTHKGLISYIAGDPAKKGYFQNVLMSRRQDMSMRSTIVPEPALDLDEVGIPRSKAFTLFRPFVIKKLVEIGGAGSIPEAAKVLGAKNAHKNPDVNRALELAIQDRPILLKRDPALHRHSLQAFKVKLVSGKAIQIHPLVTGGYNADFDGDQMNVYVPIHPDAVKEARGMMPSNNLFSEASGRVVYTPTLESALGLYKLSRVDGHSGKVFKTPAEALTAVNDKKIKVTDTVTIDDKKTTPGRILIASALPTTMQDKILYDHTHVIDKGGLNKMFQTLALEHKLGFGDAANKLKDIGNGASYGAVPIFHGQKGPAAIALAEKGLKHVYMPTHSLGLDDLEPDVKTRDRVLGKAKKDADLIASSTSLTKGEKERRSVDVWLNASAKMEKEHAAKTHDNPNNLAMMLKAGVKPAGFQYKQLALAPVLMSDANGKPILSPITKSYSEGLDVAGYWTQQQGARRGTVMKVQEVREPGSFLKRLVSSSMDQVIAEHDCGTKEGLFLPVTDASVLDRHLAADVKVGNAHFTAGTVVTPDVIGCIRAADKNAKILVRSPLKCEHAQGLCKLCAGLRPGGTSYALGTNVGIIAAQSIGERSVQLTMKAFHSGGVVQSGAEQRSVNDFERVQQLTDLTEHMRDASTLAMHSGKIDKIDTDRTGATVWIGGIKHHVGKDHYGNSLHTPQVGDARSAAYKPWQPPQVGMTVRAGDQLSDPNRTSINPRDLYKATGNMERVQNFLVHEISDIYGKDVNRRHVESIVRSMGNLTKVEDAGDADGVIKGEFKRASMVRSMNKELVKAGKRPIEHRPVLKGVDHMPQAVQEDWMAKMQHTGLRATLTEAASVAAKSNIHGLHPIPGLVYGAEFGLTSEHSLQPGRLHLKDVAPAAY